MEILTWLQTHAGELLVTFTAVVTAASAISALTPTPADDTLVGKLYKILDFLSLNFGKAKDKADEVK